MRQQIEALREDNLRLQSHLQALGSAEAASESAVHQLEIAVSLVNAVDPSQLEVLKKVVLGLFDHPLDLKIIESAIDVEDITPEEEPPLDPQTDEDPTMTVTEVVKSNGHGKIGDFIKTSFIDNWQDKDLNDLSVKEIRTLCEQEGIDWKDSDGKIISKKDLIELLELRKTVTIN